MELEGGNIMIHGPGMMEFKASRIDVAVPLFTEIEEKVTVLIGDGVGNFGRIQI